MSGMFSMGMIMVVVIMSSISSCTSIGLIEGESAPQVLALPVWSSCCGTAGHQEQHAKAAESVHNLQNY